MSDIVMRNALDGGDDDVWAQYEQAQNILGGIGANTRYLYLSGGTLYLSPGMIGITPDTSHYYAVSNTVARSISVAGKTASCWAQIELSISGGIVVTAITSMAGETNPASIPANFANSYDGTKGGFYITASNRCVGVVWINAAGVPTGVVNGIGGIDGYVGYGTSDDANTVNYDFFYINKNIGKRVLDVYSKSALFTIPSDTHDKIVFCTSGTWNLTFPSAATVGSGCEIIVILGAIGTGVITCVRNGTDTFSGLTTLTLQEQYKCYRFTSDGTATWIANSEPPMTGWTSWTPTITNLTAGAGTNIGYYRKIGKMVHFYTNWKFAAGAAIGGALTLNFPVTISSNYGQETPIGIVRILDSGTATFAGYIFSSGLIMVGNASGTYLSMSNIANTVPMTWTTNDELTMQGAYESA